MFASYTQYEGSLSLHTQYEGSLSLHTQYEGSLSLHTQYEGSLSLQLHLTYLKSCPWVIIVVHMMNLGFAERAVQYYLMKYNKSHPLR